MSVAGAAAAVVAAAATALYFWRNRRPVAAHLGFVR